LRQLPQLTASKLDPIFGTPLVAVEAASRRIVFVDAGAWSEAALSS
jgi:hypothetical protein